MSDVLEELSGPAREAVRTATLTAPRSVSWFVPGRIELLGKHTDYAGGRSLLAAVDVGHTVSATARPDRLLVVRSEVADGVVTIDLDQRHARPAEEGDGHWSGYVRTVADRLDANFPGRVRGADLTVTSTLPLAAGMSSSSALVVGLALCLIDLSEIAADPAFTSEITSPEQLGEYLGTVENGQSFGALAGHRGVGTFGGSEDHTAMLCAVPEALVQYSFCPVRHERTIDFQPGLALAVAVSGVEAAKTGAARDHYNRVSLAVTEILRRWNEDSGRGDITLADAIAAGPRAVDRLRELIADDDYLGGRLTQFLEESGRIIPAASEALEQEDLEGFGALVDQSQRGAETGLCNQVDETIALQRIARELGAHAASAFGAGFGGSVWALVPEQEAGAFAERWAAHYHRAHPDAVQVRTLVTRPGASAHRVTD